MHVVDLDYLSNLKSAWATIKLIKKGELTLRVVVPEHRGRV